jgi:hypothetical protein
MQIFSFPDFVRSFLLCFFPINFSIQFLSPFPRIYLKTGTFSDISLLITWALTNKASSHGPNLLLFNFFNWNYTVQSPNFVTAHNFVTPAENFCEPLFGFQL